VAKPKEDRRMEYAISNKKRCFPSPKPRQTKTRRRLIPTSNIKKSESDLSDHHDFRSWHTPLPHLLLHLPPLPLPLRPLQTLPLRHPHHAFKIRRLCQHPMVRHRHPLRLRFPRHLLSSHFPPRQLPRLPLPLPIPLLAIRLGQHLPPSRRPPLQLLLPDLPLDPIRNQPQAQGPRQQPHPLHAQPPRLLRRGCLRPGPGPRTHSPGLRGPARRHACHVRLAQPQGDLRALRGERGRARRRRTRTCGTL